MVNLANLLTLLRIILIPTFATLFLYGRHFEAFVAFAVAALTDWLDGWVARGPGQRTELGAFLDPLADKALLLTSFALLASTRVVPLWALVLVFTREVVIVGGWIVGHLITRNRRVEPSGLGKATTAMQLAAVTAILFNHHTVLPHDLALRALDAAMALTAISGLDYLYRGLRDLQPRRPG
ncbi:MAG: CDP-alcohol phosphatidyltransferase family protein [Candidatus Coatesbacteria bacterium]